KPSNILIDSANRPYITDFGLARMTQTSQSTMSQDMLMGTPHYMSPEQAKGTEELTPATDIYSLGVILYEFAVGQVPFSGNTPYAIVHDHIYTALPQTRDFNPDVSPEVEEVLIRALAKNPPDRYPTAVEMLNAFKQAVIAGSASPTKVTPPNPDRTIAAIATPIPSYTIGAPVEPLPVTPPNNSSRWLISAGILGILIVIALSAVIIGSSTSAKTQTPLPTLASLAITASSLPEGTTVNAPAPTNNAPADLSVDQSQTALANNLNDPAAYLVLAKAAWQQNQTDVAQKAVQDGLSITPDKINYLLEAAKIAQDVNRLTASVYLDTQALIRAQSNPSIYPDVRAQVGKALYTAAKTPDQINLRELDRLNKSITDFQLPDLFDIMSVQILVNQKRLPLAQAAFNRLSDETSKLPEAYLVHGELLQAQGSSEKAKKEWKAILQMPNTPQWVMDRVSELLNSN
ncbi:MAG: protein kinase, partial [Chloroflexota bacterium]